MHTTLFSRLLHWWTPLRRNRLGLWVGYGTTLLLVLMAFALAGAGIKLAHDIDLLTLRHPPHGGDYVALGFVQLMNGVIFAMAPVTFGVAMVTFDFGKECRRRYRFLREGGILRLYDLYRQHPNYYTILAKQEQSQP